MKTSEYPYAQYDFEEFNPVQKETLEYLEEETNIVVASPTSSGKTIAGELIASRELSENHRVVYTGPIKALAEERYEDWTNDHSWSSQKLIVLTGDYRLTPAREKELKNAAIIITTYEMLAVRGRKAGYEKDDWIKETGCLIVDEAHFLKSENRGDHLENALIRFTRINPKARIVFLSATLKNLEDIAEWLTFLNGKETRIVQSDYRPCPLTITYNVWDNALPSGLTYQQKEKIKCQSVLDMVKRYHKDQWLIFVHGKSTGRIFLSMLREAFQEPSFFHSADLPLTKRQEIESGFRKGRIRFLVATSTLAYGVNLPARRVAIVGIHRGISEVDPLDVIQECGRAGRPRYDKEGTAYIFIQGRKLTRWRHLIEDGIDVVSVLHRAVGFHLIGEIATERVSTPAEVDEWIKLTLSYKQGCLRNDTYFKTVLKVYENHRLIRKSNDTDGDWTESGESENYKATRLGRIASVHYFDPLDVADWKDNIAKLHDKELLYNDTAVAWMISSRFTLSEGYVPNELKVESNSYLGELRSMGLYNRGPFALTQGTVLQMMLEDPDRADAFMFIKSPFMQDRERILTCLKDISEWYLFLKIPEYWEALMIRFSYGVGWNAVELCKIPGIGRKYSQTLIEGGIRTVKDIERRISEVRDLLPESTFKKVKGYINDHSKNG